MSQHRPLNFKYHLTQVLAMKENWVYRAHQIQMKKYFLHIWKQQIDSNINGRTIQMNYLKHLNRKRYFQYYQENTKSCQASSGQGFFQ